MTFGNYVLTYMFYIVDEFVFKLLHVEFLVLLPMKKKT